MEDLDRLYEALALKPVIGEGACHPYAGGIITEIFVRYICKWYSYRCIEEKQIKPTDWYMDGKKHPDVFYFNAEGKLHRIYGPAYINRHYKWEMWYKDGLLHREDGPAIIHKNNKYWFQEGTLHRMDGPAVEDLGSPPMYFIRGVRFSPKQYKWEIARLKRKQTL
jgi:hypothetical protein